ncbi:hypothetical protein [Brachybacterium vulturis]|uniref:hypothetical protein n=1 Tax=Brachybacterium vulturis TaxID=2017484 RepID=UPI003736C3B4
MGTRGRDRPTGRALPMGWGAETASPGSDTPTGRSGLHPDPDGADGPEPAAAPHGRSRPSRRSRRLIAVCAVLALVVGLLIALPRLLGAATGPEHVTEEFLQAVVDGDLDTVRAHTQDASSASAAALTAEVLAGAEDRLDSFEIQHVAVQAGAATVTAELRTGAERGEGTFTLTSSDDGPFSPTVWELAPVVLPELQIDLTFGVQEIEIGGATFPVHEILVDRETSEPRVAVQLLPGTYEVRLPQVPPHVEAPHRALEVPATFGSERMPVHDLQLTLDEDGQTEVQHQIDAALEECTASTSSAPEGCPFAVPDPEEDETAIGGVLPVVERGTWALISSPHIASSPVNAFLWTVQGVGTAEFTPADGAAPIDVPFMVAGTAALTGQGALEVRLHSAGAVPFGYCTDAETGVITGVVLLEEPEQDLVSECG